MQLPEPYHSLFEAILWASGADAIPGLVKRGADLNYVDPYLGRTPLYAACVSDRVRVIEALLQHGAKPSQQFTYRSPVDKRVEADMTALHYAASPEAVAALIRAGADVNAADATGTTPLMRAAFVARKSVVSALLAAGASPLLRQQKRRGRKPHTARELAESKIEFFRGGTSGQNSAAVEQRIRCYGETRDILLEAERGAAV